MRILCWFGWHFFTESDDNWIFGCKHCRGRWQETPIGYYRLR